MKNQHSKDAFTLVELLVIIGVIVIIAALFLPTLSGSERNSKLGRCLNNLKQIDLGFAIYANDNGENYPMQISAKNGGTKEFTFTKYTFLHFEKLNRYVPETKLLKFLVCPSDTNRWAAADFASLNNLNISYFINAIGPITNCSPQSLLCGDRNLTLDGQPAKVGPLLVTTNSNIDWSTSEIHRRVGNLAFADGSASWNSMGHFKNIIQQQPLATNRFCFP